MRNFLWTILLLVLGIVCGPAWAQSFTAQNVQTGYMSPPGQNGCPATQACFVPYGAATPVTPGSVTLIPLDIATVTTGGTAVNALSAGHAAHGGTIITANAAGMCVDQQATAGVATGTPSTTMCVSANQPFNLWPSSHAVSVNSTASSVTLGGEGAN